jgi:hypothetical protein
VRARIVASSRSGAGVGAAGSPAVAREAKIGHAASAMSAPAARPSQLR